MLTRIEIWTRFWKIGRYGFQDRDCDFEWETLCSLSVRHGNIVENQGALAIYKGCDYRTEGWLS